MFTNIRVWIQHQLSSRKAPTADHLRASAAQTRQARAETVERLQHDIRNLQQRITDLSDAMEMPNASADHRQGDGEMHSLHQQLAQKQQELSHYQARI